ncbi:hypothetical protein SAY86_017543 [Trapa natans]|uniref:Pre-mRNA polyadenylation factor Fip1 domain-containing protein n=1 Tax=Trapa natans TaxID=22666 RepID=A0AAN7LRH1_TRANT|nr:hypothetical protein SAY86_017543 [Trapa natans]
MEEDDEFGDLYTDVLRPLTSSSQPPQKSTQILSHPSPSPSPSPPHRPFDLNLKVHDHEILPGGAPTHTPVHLAQHGVEPRVLVRPETNLSNMPLEGVKLLINPKAELPREIKSVDLMDTDVKFDIEEDDVPHIPGVSGMPAQSNGVDTAAGDYWDSDSEDELKIVLNDDPQLGPAGMFGEDDDDDEDGEPLVIVDGGVPSRPMEEVNWCEDAVQLGPDGEKKEAAGAEAEKAAGGGVAVVPKIGYSSHAYHPFHSQFKYVRPGAAPLPVSSTPSSAGTSGQVQPHGNAGPIAGRGRGEWRQSGVKGGPGLQKYPGYGAPTWGLGRGYGGGLDFTLPSHKTIFEVDIDSFEEKPWKYPGIDSTEFFNFGLDEESWKDYCKQLGQRRFETAPQSRIRVYESVRTEKEFDPDMPPELAAATGILDAADNVNAAKLEAAQIDVKLPARVRPALPTGRPIQVESGSGERLPSIDTRPPRIRDADAIIEYICPDEQIICQEDSLDDDSSIGRGVMDKHDIELPCADARNDPIAERGNAPEENENSDTGIGQKKEPISRRTQAMDFVHYNAAEGDEMITAKAHHPSASQGQTHSPSRNNGILDDERTSFGTHGGSPCVSPACSREEKKPCDSQEGSAESMSRKRTAHESSLGQGVATPLPDDRISEPENESSLGQGVVTPLPGDRISEPEKEELELDEQTSTGTFKDHGSPHSRVKRRCSPQTEEPELEVDDIEDSRAGRSSENSKARSGSSREYQKWHDGVEEEVVQTGRPSRSGGTKRHLSQNERDYRRKGPEVTRETESNHVVAKGQEGSYRDWDQDQSTLHNIPMKPEGSDRRKERSPYDRSWQRRDDDTQNTRDRKEDTRKRFRPDETGFRHKSRAHESERSEKDENPLPSSRKHLDNGVYDANLDKDVSSRGREKDDNLRSGRPESAGDFHSKRRREDEYSKRDRADKEEILHPRRDSASRQKRERDDDRKRDEHPRERDDIEDRHPLRSKEDSSLNRERSEKQKKPRSAQDENVRRERGHGNLKGGRSAEDKARASHVKTRDGHKILDKDQHSKDASRLVEQVKAREFSVDESSHQRGRVDTHSRGKEASREEKRSRQERPTARNDHRTRERGHKESMKKMKDSEGGDNNSAVITKRNQDGQRDHVTETGGGNGGNSEVTLHHQSSRKHREYASSEDEQSDSRRGRSKLERWTSQKERDFTVSSKSSSSSKLKELGRSSNGGTSESGNLPVESSKPDDLPASDQQGAIKEGDKTGNSAENKLSDNRHLDTVEKLKKRSERFKLPMPGGKETAVAKKIENEVLSSSAKTETPAESETKHERPARKRRWTSN